MAGSKRPAVRARSARDALHYLDRYRPGATQEARGHIPPESLRIIEESASTAWIPIEHDRHVPRSVVAVFGEQEAVRCFAEFLPSHLESPLLRSILHGTRRMFGLSPGSFVGVAPRAWQLVYRDCMTLRVLDRGRNGAVLAMEDIAPEIMAESAYFISFEGFFSGFFGLCGVEGEVELTVESARNEAVIRFYW